MNQKKSKKLKLVIASSNAGKIIEFRKLLDDFPLEIIGQPKDFYVEENGKTFAENARIKAIAVAKETGHLSLSDDSGLCVDSLDGRPGVFSSRYANSDKERISRLLGEMENILARSAYFCAALCLASPFQEILLEVEGQCKGLITNSPRGNKGFGYDPIFEVVGSGLTFAEMGSDEKQARSHRGKAFALLKPGIEKLLNSQFFLSSL